MAAPLQCINFSRCHAAEFLPEKFEPGVSVYRSPAAESLFKLLGSRRRPTVLDFGPLIRDNIELLTGFYCKLLVEDFHQGLPEEELAQLPDCKLDVVLCWDMFNYLDRPRAERLIRALSRRMAPGALLVMHLGSGEHVSKSPLGFRLVDRMHVSCETTSKEALKHPALTARVLRAMMDGWKPEHSVQLRNSLQEHLFSYVGKS